jgi:hypothetical protein
MCLALCLIMLPAGCTLVSSNQLPFGKKEPEFETPRQLVPVWSDTVLHQAGMAATRGFGGRLMFYGQDKHKPIRVEGSLIVYAWDDSKGSMERAPDRKYVFPSEALQNHYSASTLGHSYSFWVPWDAAGGPLQHVTLISRFLSSDGTELTGAPAHVVLQGPGGSTPFPSELLNPEANSKTSADKDRLAAHLRNKEDGGVQRISYETEEVNARRTDQRSYTKPAHPGLQTSEIGLTRGFYERNMQGSANDADSSEFNAVDAEDLLAPAAAGTAPGLESVGHSLKSANSPHDHADAAESAEASDQQSTRFPPFESRVRTSRATRSSAGHVRKEPLRARWLNGLPETPRSSTNEIE